MKKQDAITTTTVRLACPSRKNQMTLENSCAITEVNCTCIIESGDWLGCVPFNVHDLIANANVNLNDKII